MKEISLVYENGNTKTVPYAQFGKTLEELIREVKARKGRLFHDFKISPLRRAYVDGELVLDHKEVFPNEDAVH